MRSIKEECLERMIFFGETSLRNAVREFLVHYHAERNHQGLENRLIAPGEGVGRTTGADRMSRTTRRLAAVLLTGKRPEDDACWDDRRFPPRASRAGTDVCQHRRSIASTAFRCRLSGEIEKLSRSQALFDQGFGARLSFLTTRDPAHPLPGRDLHPLEIAAFARRTVS